MICTALPNHDLTSNVEKRLGWLEGQPGHHDLRVTVWRQPHGVGDALSRIGIDNAPHCPPGAVDHLSKFVQWVHEAMLREVAITNRRGQNRTVSDGSAGQRLYGCAVDPYPTIAFGIDLRLTATKDGGRTAPLGNSPGAKFTYRPNWGLPSMTPPHEQSGAPVLAFSRDVVLPGQSVYAVVVPPFPEMVDRWDLEVQPGVVLPMYEGARVCGHGTVIWRRNITLPLDRAEEQRLRTWLARPETPLGDE